MKLQTKYLILKATTITLGALSIPWGTYTGFCFGQGNYFAALISLSAQTTVALVDGFIWFWVLENMKNRLEEEKGKVPALAEIIKNISPQDPDEKDNRTILPLFEPCSGPFKQTGMTISFSEPTSRVEDQSRVCEHCSRIPAKQ